MPRGPDPIPPSGSGVFFFFLSSVCGRIFFSRRSVPVHRCSIALLLYFLLLYDLLSSRIHLRGCKKGFFVFFRQRITRCILSAVSRPGGYFFSYVSFMIIFK